MPSTEQDSSQGICQFSSASANTMTSSPRLSSPSNTTLINSLISFSSRVAQLKKMMEDIIRIE
jgi:hypothetical protein